MKSNYAYIFDLDGTLAVINHRRWMVTNGNKKWEKFFKACVDDTPNYDVVNVYKELQKLGYTMIILSGRCSSVRKQTESWLFKNGISYDRLIMRNIGDFTPDEKLKSDWLDYLVNEEEYTSYYDILGVFDDRQKVVDMWRSKKLTCFQVAPGKF